MANYTEDAKENTDLHQQMPAQNITPEVDRQVIQQYTLENDKAQCSAKQFKRLIIPFTKCIQQSLI